MKRRIGGRPANVPSFFEWRVRSIVSRPRLRTSRPSAARRRYRTSYVVIDGGRRSRHPSHSRGTAPSPAAQACWSMSLIPVMPWTATDGVSRSTLNRTRNRRSGLRHHGTATAPTATTWSGLRHRNRKPESRTTKRRALWALHRPTSRSNERRQAFQESGWPTADRARRDLGGNSRKTRQDEDLTGSQHLTLVTAAEVAMLASSRSLAVPCRGVSSNAPPPPQYDLQPYPRPCETPPRARQLLARGRETLERRTADRRLRGETEHASHVHQRPQRVLLELKRRPPFADAVDDGRSSKNVKRRSAMQSLASTCTKSRSTASTTAASTSLPQRLLAEDRPQIQQRASTIGPPPNRIADPVAVGASAIRQRTRHSNAARTACLSAAGSRTPTGRRRRGEGRPAPPR